MKILVWNLRWPVLGKKPEILIREQIEQIAPDIACFTEDVTERTLTGHPIESDPDYGCKAPKCRRKVILWSRKRWEAVNTHGDDGLPTGRFVSGVSFGVRFVGVCIPWRDAHVKTCKKDKLPWQDHVSYCTALARILDRYSTGPLPVCVLGDFNQTIPCSTQPKWVADALTKALQDRFTVATAGETYKDSRDGKPKLLIDHIAVSQGISVSNISILPKVANDGTSLSDHVGLMAQLNHHS